MMMMMMMKWNNFDLIFLWVFFLYKFSPAQLIINILNIVCTIVTLYVYFFRIYKCVWFNENFIIWKNIHIKNTHTHDIKCRKTRAHHAMKNYFKQNEYEIKDNPRLSTSCHVFILCTCNCVIVIKKNIHVKYCVCKIKIPLNLNKRHPPRRIPTQNTYIETSSFTKCIRTIKTCCQHHAKYGLPTFWSEVEILLLLISHVNI